jgi:hypothetical protein
MVVFLERISVVLMRPQLVLLTVGCYSKSKIGVSLVFDLTHCYLSFFKKCTYSHQFTDSVL